MNNTEEHVEATIEDHEGLIKTPKQLIVTVILAFIVPILVILLLIKLVMTTSFMGSGSDAQSAEAIATRIKPVAGFALVDANAPKVFKTGQQVFDTTCTACHTAGVAGAHKIGDSAAWAPFIKKGYETLVKNAIHGLNAMPPKGGNPALSDFEVARAVVYMANKSGASFEEPTEPAGDKAEAAAKPAATAAAAPAPAPAAAPAAAPKAEAPKAAAAAPAAAAPAAAPAADTASIDPAGEKLYKAVCFACHASGVANAPKFGDKAAWAKYVATGMDTMVQNAIHGVGAMPPRGGSQASDAEMKAAVQYMVQSVQ
ncbi:cytochrome c5 family protein [Candidimonas sp. SYP-B2681]|uniref:c-type cytochrome n=1 Tax=Candidimonas sp. SYP-B2681 TaxID=2497686 RepID=UPI000F8653EB|nr:c-type cytochrome [Candidimonas sp. SYP-B2681]RTZ45755.1 cytochrome c5 family protein [Candidimonas sp. SYP-B2681]